MARYEYNVSTGETIELPDLPENLPSIDERRESLWERVKGIRTIRKDGGVQAGGHWFQTDNDSRIQFLRLDKKASDALSAGGAASDVLTVMGQPIHWKTADNGLVPMTVSLAQAVVLAVEVLDAMAHARAEVLRQQIEASDNPEAIDIFSGWPTVYETS